MKKFKFTIHGNQYDVEIMNVNIHFGPVGEIEGTVQFTR